MNFFTNLEQPSEEFQNTDTRVNESPNNHTPGGTWVSRLNPIENTAIGPSISLAVSPGDEIDIEVFARYLEGTQGNTSAVDNLAALLASAFANGAGTSEQINLAETFGNALGGAVAVTQDNPDVPKAYLQYMIFDKDMQIQQHGHQVLMPEALNGWQKMHLDVNVQHNGYIYIFVANESMADIGVYFDDMRVQHTESPATSASDYYPFGLTMINRSYTSEPYRFGYQGQFAEYDEETGWNSFELRQYDPVIGRWTSADPMRQYWSPYNGNGNSPIMNIDPTGGKNPVATSDGKFRGYDSEGANGGTLIIYDGDDFVEGMSQEHILNNGGEFLDDFFLNWNFKLGEVMDWVEKYSANFDKDRYNTSLIVTGGLIKDWSMVASMMNWGVSNPVIALETSGSQTAILLSKQGFSKGATAQLTLANGKSFVGVSSSIRHFHLTDEMTGILMNAGRTGSRPIPSWYDGCAEVSAIQQARAAGYSWTQIRAASLTAYNVGKNAGSVKPMCNGCLNMLDILPK